MKNVDKLVGEFSTQINECRDDPLALNELIKEIATKVSKEQKTPECQLIQEENSRISEEKDTYNLILPNLEEYKHLEGKTATIYVSDAPDAPDCKKVYIVKNKREVERENVEYKQEQRRYNDLIKDVLENSLKDDTGNLRIHPDRLMTLLRRRANLVRLARKGKEGSTGSITRFGDTYCFIGGYLEYFQFEKELTLSISASDDEATYSLLRFSTPVSDFQKTYYKTLFHNTVELCRDESVGGVFDLNLVIKRLQDRFKDAEITPSPKTRFTLAKEKYLEELEVEKKEGILDKDFLPCLEILNKCQWLCSTQCCSGHEGSASSLYFSFISCFNKDKTSELLRYIEETFRKYDPFFNISFDGHYSERYTVWNLPPNPEYFTKIVKETTRLFYAEDK